MTEITKQNSYDETPYQSYPYSQSSPEKLATLGTLFGMTPPPIETARVLELGCAEGGNIIPHAIHYPKGQYVGVDLSKVQIDAGKEHIKAMGLKNIELKHCSITDIDASFGKFDYIICHGVMSWVPEFVRDKILEIANNNLTENGIAYISYNTLPGWNMVRTIRDMMIYHSKGFEAPQEKITQSRALLAFVKESLDGVKTPYAQVLAQETELLSKQGDHYIRHDHLEEENKQFYFNEFMTLAATNNLQYLSDCSLSSMYLGNMGADIVNKLKDLNDIVRTEQYMDFITNRRFRSTLLCHSSMKLNRSLNNEDIRKFTLSLDITPEKPLSEVNLESAESSTFYFKGNKEQHVSSTSPWLKAILYTLAENKGFPIKFNTLIDKANKKFKTDRKAQIEIDLINNAMNLVVKGYMEIGLLERDKEKINLEKPAISKLASYQVKNTSNNWVTSVDHVPIGVNLLDKFILSHIDGKNTKEQIVELLAKEAVDGKITLNKDNKKLENAAEIKQELATNLESTIEKFSMQGILL